METTLGTSEVPQLPSSPTEWKLERFTRNEDNDSLRITTNQNFVIELTGRKNILCMIATCARRDVEVVLPDTSRIKITDRGDVLVMDTDPWLNKGFAPGQFVGSAWILAHAITAFWIAHYE